MRKCAYGFSLVELLVVIAVMVIVGVLAISNYKSFGEDQNLKNAVLDIQSQLRLAQSNATSNTKCNTGYGAVWQVESVNTTTVKLNCQEPLPSPPPSPLPTPISKKTLTLGANIVIQGVSGTGSSCPTAPPPPAFSVRFSPVSGAMDFIDSTGAPMSNCTSITLTLKNNKTESTKNLFIEKGGVGSKGVSIYAK